MKVDISPNDTFEHRFDEVGTMPRRFFLWLGVAGLVASLAVTVLGWRLVDRTGATIASSLELTAEAVTAVEATIDLAADSVGVAADGISTLDDALANTDATLADISIVLSQTAEAIGADVPESIDAIRTTMPALIQSADVLSSALDALQFVGVDFSPEVAPADSLRRVDQGLEDVANRLREGSDQLSTVATDFAGLSGDASAVADDLRKLGESLAEADVLLSGYETTAARVSAVVGATTDEMNAQRAEARILVIVFGLLVAGSQLVPLTLGMRSPAATSRRLHRIRV